MGREMRAQEIELKYTSKKTQDRINIINSESVFNLAKNTIYDEGIIELREQVYVVLVNRRNRVIGWHQIGRGTTVASAVNISHMLASAILANATGLILIHNHPSGKLKPIRQDAHKKSTSSCQDCEHATA